MINDIKSTNDELLESKSDTFTCQAGDSPFIADAFRRRISSLSSDPRVETYMDIMELESLMRLGQQQADEAIDATGFVGGRVNSAFFNSIGSMAFGALAVTSAINLFSGGGDAGYLSYWSAILPGGKAKATTWIYLFCFFIGLGSIPTAVRAYSLINRNYRLSHFAGCCLRIWIGFSKICIGVGFVVVVSDFSVLLCVVGAIATICGLLFFISGIMSYIKYFDAAQFLIESMNFIMAINFIVIACGGDVIRNFRWIAAPLALIFFTKFAFDVKTKLEKSRTAHSYIIADIYKYAMKWSEFLSMDGTLRLLDELQVQVTLCMENVVVGYEVSTPSHELQAKSIGQSLTSNNRIVTQGIRQKLLDISSSADANKPRQRYDHLGVLLNHAFKLNDYFQKVCGEWAAVSGFQQRNQFGRTGLAGHHHICPVKKRDRVIQKLYRTYNGDATRILDLVRSAITFEHMEDLLTCLTHIRKDPRVAILNVKNRFTTDYDGQISAGYRNVALNLALVDEHTLRLGVEFHIAELQLGLKIMDDLKNDVGHANYVRFRNARAE
jgi:hypothetical protein